MIVHLNSGTQSEPLALLRLGGESKLEELRHWIPFGLYQHGLVELKVATLHALNLLKAAEVYALELVNYTS